jgi:sugar phosphate isomerase/epimerase
MNQLVLCDDGKVNDVAPLCRTHAAGIEVQAFYDPQVLEQFPDSLQEHKQAIRGITPVAIHGCFGDLCPGSFDARVSGVARERFEQSYGAAVELGARHLILHHGYVPHTTPPFAWIKSSVKFWYDFLAGKDHNIKIHLENMLELEPKLISDVVRNISRDNLDINLDIGHAHCNSTTPVVKWIEYLGPQIGYVHLHDNHGKEDEHLGLGLGTIPLNEVCQALKDCAPKAIWAIEAEGEGLQQSLEWLRRFGFLDK